ncbi:MAG: Sec-independent protein translocase protein TatB [Sinimarinibacterium flocculans]|uniref:Sec-independent protein translocase protein TatB n=1 Tax=Sinimarinibacterium flocculans TaxID=985250 RepID=UPI003C330F0E
MFDLSFIEIALCMVIALIVLGPEKLPKVARTVGRWAGQARGYLRNLTAELDREARLSELKQQLDEANRVVREQNRSLNSAIEKTVSELGKDTPPKP